MSHYIYYSMRSFTVWLIAICCCLSWSARADEIQHFGLQRLTLENGLASNTLFEIHQDKKGFLWLGTDVGLSRYDGVHFHYYDLFQVEPQAIERICEMEADNLLWLKLGRHSQIACFDKTTGLYIPLKTAQKELLDNIHDICIADSALYVLTSEGISRLDYRYNGKDITITPVVVAEYAIPLKKLDCDKSQLYALDAANNIQIYNYRNKTKNIFKYERLKTNKSVRNIQLLNGHLWITTNWNGTYCYRPETDELRKLKPANKHLDDMLVSSIAMKDEQTFLMATPYSILRIAFTGTDYIYDDLETTEMSFDNLTYDSFINNRINKLYVDRKNKVVWLGTFGKGLLKSNMQDNQVKRILLDKDIYNVNGVVQDAHGYVWLTTEYHGIWKSNSNQFSSATKFSLWENSKSKGRYTIYRDRSGSLWIADDEGVVQWLNPLSNHRVEFRPKYDGEHSIGIINKIYHCIHNRLWLVSEKGLFIYDYQTDKCLASMPYNDTIQKVTSLYEDGDGIMWLGTNNGVKSAKVKDNNIELAHGQEEQFGISRGEVLVVYVNRHNQLYISYADKIVQTDGQRNGIADIKIIKKDMMSGHIQCIIDDKSGNTWMGNNIGIMTVNNRTKASYTYSFPERFYNVCQLNDGRLLWSTSNGLLYFNPQELKRNSLTAPLYISDIGINYNLVEIGENVNDQIILKKPVYQLEELVLDHANNSLVFYLTNLCYNQMPNKIEYRLLPIQEKWEKSYKTEIEFSDLKAGKYTLEVRPTSINEEDVTTTRLNIIVKKHWAVTNIAIMVYLILAGFFSALLGFYLRARAARHLFNQKKDELLRNTLAEEIKGRKEEKTVQHLRDQARYSLIREMHTPLSLISAPLKEMVNMPGLSPLLKQKAKMAYRNAVSMQDVCNLMQDIYQQENEILKLDVSYYSISEILNNALATSNELLNMAPIKLHYDKNKLIKEGIWVDRKKIEYIIRNVLSNAYRHISYSGDVYIQVSFETINNKKYCCYQIKDNGKSMIKKSATFQLSKEEGGEELTSQLHAELGIILMKEHITAHHGDIHIAQDEENGSCVKIYIPLGKEHFENDARVKFIEPEVMQIAPEETKALVTAEEKSRQIEEEQENLSLLTQPTNGKHKILVIEDHKDIRLYLKVLFSSNYTVIMAENGEEGVKMARCEMPDIILSDVMMPVMNGLECTRILKEDLKTCHIPIIILTALVGDADVVKGIEMGADDYILKPFNPDILRSKVKRLIKNRMDLKQAYMKLMMAGTSSSEKEEDGQKEDPFIRQIFDIVEKNLQNPDFNVKRLAEMVNMSQPTLYRRVKMLTSYTIIELIRGVRLKRAAELLRTQKYSIQEVSEMVGYNDTPTFRKHFVELYGTTPSTFVSKEEEKNKCIAK